MKRKRLFWMLYLYLLLCCALPFCMPALAAQVDAQVSTQTEAPAPSARPQALPVKREHIRIALYQGAPFSMEENGVWRGISVQLWMHMARELELDFSLTPYPDVQAVLQAVRDGSADLGVGPISVTPEREAEFDFTHPFYHGGPEILTQKQQLNPIKLLLGLINLNFFKALGALVSILLIFGFLIWAFERRRNSEQFGGSAMEGIGNGFWWSAVTMTTVGYGDKAPITPLGRLVGLVWMFLSIITISGFTAAIASSITLSTLTSRISEMSDLPRSRVGAVGTTSNSDYLSQLQIPHRKYTRLDEALQDLKNDRIDALVHDGPILRYLMAQNDYPELTLLSETLREENYAFVTRPDDPRLESYNRALLKQVSTSDWLTLLHGYLR